MPPDRPEIQNIVWSTMRGIEDETVTLTCISRGGFPAPYLDWYMGSTKLTSTRTETEQADGTTTVTITFSFKATRSLDKTNYICKSSFDPPDSPLASYVRLFLSCKYILQTVHIPLHRSVTVNLDLLHVYFNK